jgi:SNF2 family DNA or RNA helicase
MIFMTFTTKPMEHQQKAIDKLSKTKVGALYMDMGTGKTRTALGLAVPRLLEGKVDCILWLCPVSVKQTIADEIQKHLPDATFEIISTSGIKDMNANIYIAGIESLSQSLSLDFILLDLVSKKRCFIVVDESSLVKNHMAKRTRSIWRLGERARYKLILNGTPISNNEQDLYSQWYFLDPRVLGYTSFYSFAANHLEYDSRIPGRVVRAHNIEYLVSKMQPFVYQVRKDECLELPPKSYSKRYCRMTADQYWEYEHGKTHFFDIMERYDDWHRDVSTIVFRLFSLLQRVVSGKTWDWKDLFDNPLKNPRVQLLLETIMDLPTDSKAIIWCKYTHEIEMISEVLTQAGYESARLYGGLTVKERERELERFKTDAEFLVVNKGCGAFGLNLQFANYAIYYSNDWSWETRSQSEDRIHRTGQTQNVHIIDLICENTIDERIYTSLMNKEGLVESFRREIDKQKGSMDKEDFWRWLNGDQSWAKLKRKTRSS